MPPGELQGPLVSGPVKQRVFARQHIGAGRFAQSFISSRVGFELFGALIGSSVIHRLWGGPF